MLFRSIEVLELRNRLSDMQQEAIYFRGCYDSVGYLKKAGILQQLLSEKIHDEILEMIIKNATDEDMVLNEGRLMEVFQEGPAAR